MGKSISLVDSCCFALQVFILTLRSYISLGILAWVNVHTILLTPSSNIPHTINTISITHRRIICDESQVHSRNKRWAHRDRFDYPDNGSQQFH
jgi:hypothetical protein